MAKKEGQHYRYEHLEYWAEGGMVALLDLRKAGHGSDVPAEAVTRLTATEFLKRAIAVRIGVGDRYQSQARAASQLLERAKEVAKLAMAQGSPTDPQAMAHAKHQNQRSRLFIPGQPGLQLPYTEKIRPKDPRSTLLHGVELTKDTTIVPDYVIKAGPARRRRPHVNS